MHGANLFSPGRLDRWKGQEIVWNALSLMQNGLAIRLFQSDPGMGA